MDSPGTENFVRWVTYKFFLPVCHRIAMWGTIAELGHLPGQSGHLSPVRPDGGLSQGCLERGSDSRFLQICHTSEPCLEDETISTARSHRHEVNRLANHDEARRLAGGVQFGPDSREGGSSDLLPPKTR